MTREQMIDIAVQRTMKPVTMRRVDRIAKNVVHIRHTCVPHEWTSQDPGPENAAALFWFEGSIAEYALSPFSGRVKKIRAEFRRLNDSRIRLV